MAAYDPPRTIWCDVCQQWTEAPGAELAGEGRLTPVPICHHCWYAMPVAERAAYAATVRYQRRIAAAAKLLEIVVREARFDVDRDAGG